MALPESTLTAAPPSGATVASLPARALAGFFLSGLLFSFPGAILPVWRYHLTEYFDVVGSHFLSLNAGVLVGVCSAAWLLRRRRPLVLVFACGIACAALIFLASAPAAAGQSWRNAGMFGVGCGIGLLNSALCHTITPAYRLNPAGTINLAGLFLGLGCVVMALLVAGAFHVYTVPAILVFVALVPGYLLGIFALSPLPMAASHSQPHWTQVLDDFRNPGAVLFTLLLFFQFGNEWAIAGWLPLFLIQRIGVSPASSLFMLAVYWLALLLGRLTFVAILPRVSHGKLLMGSTLAAILGCAVLLATDNRFGAVSGILLVGTGFAPIYPLVVEKIGSRVPHYHPGLFNGLLSFALTGGLLAPWSLGYFANAFGIRVVMGLPLAGTIVVFALLLLIWAEARFHRWLTGAAGA